MIHLLQRVVNRINHKGDKVVYHTEYQCSLAQRYTKKVEQGNRSKGTHKNIYPHRQDKQYDHRLGTVQLTVTQYPCCRITQQNTNKGGNDSNTDRIYKGIDCFRMFEELLKIGECQMTAIIGKGIYDN